MSDHQYVTKKQLDMREIAIIRACGTAIKELRTKHEKLATQANEALRQANIAAIKTMLDGIMLHKAKSIGPDPQPEHIAKVVGQ